MQTPIIFWYRQDLRTHDLPGLAAAASSGRPVIPCYILDDHAPGEWATGAASRWWLHHSLVALQADIASLGGSLVLRRGETLDQLRQLIASTGADTVYCSRQYEPWAAALEKQLHEQLSTADITFKRYAGSLLFEPEQISNQSGLPYKVFTPFWRHCLKQLAPAAAQALPTQTNWLTDTLNSDCISDWGLQPTQPDWAANWPQQWQPGAVGARDKLSNFLDNGISNYSDGRNHPALDCTTRLSPHLHYGEISPRVLWHAARQAAAESPALDGQVEKFLSELGWREFSHHLLYHFPAIPEQAFKSQFRNFPWLAGADRLRAWQRGQTGYPMVDAGMRELWHTGYMHNRVRMIVASFLTKHLLVHWREGAKWFWDTLLDADLANNSSGWQWVAGSGADASPYFRIFNPMTQGKKFDAEGAYIRQWVPELDALPDRYLNCPWEAPEDILRTAGVVIGEHYPSPVVDHKAAREAALAAYASIRGA
ncbi:MAG: deoxyribodipyrimidine photo-lyase [Halioglobus sp.]